MNRILAGLQAFSDDKKWVLLLIAVILTVVYAVITIFSMAKQQRRWVSTSLAKM